MPTIDLTITPAHRTALARLRRGESVAELAECLGVLYLRGLVDDDARGPALTAAGRRALRAGGAS